MAPKSRKPSSADKSKDVQETEDPLQAVVLADSFETRFSPFTTERPRVCYVLLSSQTSVALRIWCLLPLANTPLIEYTLSFLASSGVEEVYVCCGAHTDLVEDYLLKSRWSRPSSPFKLEIIRSTSRSIGDAMRDLDKRSIMGPDFILVYGDVVSNLPLGPALAEHRARKAKDKNAVMTMVLREAGISHRTKSRGLSPVFVIDPSKNRCLHYEQISQSQPSHHISIDPDILLNTDEVDIRHDLIDCGIDICTPDVLALWSDNFDYEAPRKGFLNSVLKDYELNGKTIHTYIVKDCYSARVRDMHTYSSIGKDIISRWAYPICPDNNLLDDQSYKSYKANVFREEDVKLSRSCAIGPRTVIGKGTNIKDNSTVSNSTVGRHCSIGENCIIENSYIWENVTIGSGSVIRNSIVASDVRLGEKCVLQPGTLVSWRVELSDGVTTERRQRIVRDDNKQAEKVTNLVNGSNASNFEPSESEDSDVQAGFLERGNLETNESMSDDSISTLHSEMSEDEPVYRKHSHSSSFASVNSDDSPSSPHAGREFLADASANIFDSLQKGHDAETIQFELQGLRMATNASEHQRRHAVVSGLVQHILQIRKSGSKTTIKQILEDNATLIERQIFDKQERQKKDQVDFLLLAQAELAKNPEGSTVMVSLCNGLYASDSIEAEALEQWWNDERSTASEKLKAVRAHPKMKELMDIIAEESDDDEEDDDEEDDEDD